MPPKKTGLDALFDWAVKSDKANWYRFVMIFLMASVTPLAQFLPHIENFKPLWIAVEDVQKQQSTLLAQQQTNSAKITTIEGSLGKVSATTEDLKDRFTGFQVDFERYKATAGRPQ